MRPTVEIRHSSYENIVVDCPHCSKEVIFNRVTEIGHTNPVSGMEVLCLHSGCRLPFWITSDIVNAPFEMLLFDCYELLERKHYMQCVLLVAQSYEVLFSLYLRVHLVYKPYTRTKGARLAEVTRLVEELSDMTQDFAFNDMRTTFLSLVVAAPIPDLTASRAFISGLARNAKQPSKLDIQNLGPRVAQPLMKIKAVRIQELRNKVVHKTAYRPSLSEAQEALDEALTTLSPLGRLFDLHDDPNWHRGRSVSSIFVSQMSLK